MIISSNTILVLLGVILVQTTTSINFLEKEIEQCYDKVNLCASNGQNYKNICEFISKVEKGVSVLHKGKCKNITRKKRAYNPLAILKSKIRNDTSGPMQRKLVKHFNPVTGKWEYLVEIIPTIVITPTFHHLEIKGKQNGPKKIISTLPNLRGTTDDINNLMGTLKNGLANVRNVTPTTLNYETSSNMHLPQSSSSVENYKNSDEEEIIEEVIITDHQIQTNETSVSTSSNLPPAAIQRKSPIKKIYTTNKNPLEKQNKSAMNVDQFLLKEKLNKNNAQNSTTTENEMNITEQTPKAIVQTIEGLNKSRNSFKGSSENEDFLGSIKEKGDEKEKDAEQIDDYVSSLESPSNHFSPINSIKKAVDVIEKDNSSYAKSKKSDHEEVTFVTTSKDVSIETPNVVEVSKIINPVNMSLNNLEKTVQQVEKTENKQLSTKSNTPKAVEITENTTVSANADVQSDTTPISKPKEIIRTTKITKGKSTGKKSFHKRLSKDKGKSLLSSTNSKMLKKSSLTKPINKTGVSVLPDLSKAPLENTNNIKQLISNPVFKIKEEVEPKNTTTITTSDRLPQTADTVVKEVTTKNVISHPSKSSNINMTLKKEKTVQDNVSSDTDGTLNINRTQNQMLVNSELPVNLTYKKPQPSATNIPQNELTHSQSLEDAMEIQDNITKVTDTPLNTGIEQNNVKPQPFADVPLKQDKVTTQTGTTSDKSITDEQILPNSLLTTHSLVEDPKIQDKKIIHAGSSSNISETIEQHLEKPLVTGNIDVLNGEISNNKTQQKEVLTQTKSPVDNIVQSLIKIQEDNITDNPSNVSKLAVLESIGNNEIINNSGKFGVSKIQDNRTTHITTSANVFKQSGRYNIKLPVTINTPGQTDFILNWQLQNANSSEMGSDIRMPSVTIANNKNDISFKQNQLLSNSLASYTIDLPKNPPRALKLSFDWVLKPISEKVQTIKNDDVQLQNEKSYRLLDLLKPFQLMPASINNVLDRTREFRYTLEKNQINTKDGRPINEYFGAIINLKDDNKIGDVHIINYNSPVNSNLPVMPLFYKIFRQTLPGTIPQRQREQ